MRSRHSTLRAKGLEDLPEDTIPRLREAVESANFIEDIIIFGSYARGEADKDSDIDLCVLYRGRFRDAPCIIGKATWYIYPIMRDAGLEYDLVAFPAEFPRNESDAASHFFETIMKEGVSVCSGKHLVQRGATEDPQ